MGWKRNDPVYLNMGKFFGRILGLTFVVGVATGVVMEFQFGMNWSEYSKFVGDIFGAPLAAEAIFSFFLESTFIAIYILGRNKLSKRAHWFSILMVAVGATISAFWIIVANSWQQTPAGYAIRNERAELTSFYQAVFNPSTLPRFFHTVDAALITGAFFVAGIAAYLLLKNKENVVAQRAIRFAVIFGFIVSALELFPFGHISARQVARTQPEKIATFEGLIESREEAPMILFGIPREEPRDVVLDIQVPGLLSWLAYGDRHHPVQGMDDFPAGTLPPFVVTFATFHLMVYLGGFFILVMFIGILLHRKNAIRKTRWFLYLMLFSIPLPIIACELGWISAEVGRQPWIVYKLLRTTDGVSVTVPASQILFSIILFGVIYLLLGSLYVFLLTREIKRGPEPVTVKEVLS